MRENSTPDPVLASVRIRGGIHDIATDFAGVRAALVYGLAISTFAPEPDHLTPRPAGDQSRIVHSEARGLMDIESKNFDVAVMQGIEVNRTERV